MKERLLLKHDIATNWAKAINFVPLAGEIIIYDGILENGTYIELPRLKVGDGKTKLINLPFIEINSSVKKSSYNDKEENLILN